jgi:hypothetical protein
MLTPQASIADDLTIARQPAERDEDADEQGHRDGDPERLRHERRQHPNDDVPRRAFAISASPCCRIGGISSANVSSNNESPNGAMSSRST